MNILVTGARGFIGKNLLVELNNKGYNNIFEVTRDTTNEELFEYAKECDFVYHLAGVNRPKDDSEFMEGNYGFTSKLLEFLNENENKAPIVITSSIQAEMDNPYGRSKKAGEDIIFEHGKVNSSDVYVYRLPNVFGKWSRPNYNSVVSTFCHKIARNEEISVNDKDVELTLVYIDDILNEFTSLLESEGTKKGEFYRIPIEHKVKLGDLADLIYSFKESRVNRYIPNMGDDFTRKLYSTYLSYLPEDDFSYDLKMHEDHRGSFTEFIRTAERGQVSVNVSKPGITKGDHWHHTKNEKFLVVSGKGVIRFRKLGEEKVVEYKVSGDKLQVVDIPTGYTHSIVNLGNSDMVTIMWANECFDPDNPDTYFLEV